MIDGDFTHAEAEFTLFTPRRRRLQVPLFNSEFLKKLELLALASQRAHPGQMLANRMTRQRGQGIEFAEHRQYTTGDDLRYLDWAVYARHGELLLKRFHEERDVRVDLLLDCSRSMQVGQPAAKFEYAKQVTACLAFLALAHFDRLALTTFADLPRVPFPVTRGKQHWLKFLAVLESLETSGTDTNLVAAAERLLQANRSSGIIILISDFLDPNGFEAAIDRLRYRGLEVFLIHVYDPLEADPASGGQPLKGDVELVDAETGARRRMTLRPSDLQRYRERFAEFQSRLDGFARQHGMGYISVPTSMPYEDLVLRTMRQSGWIA